MRDAQDDGRKAYRILTSHYAGSGKPRVISLYTELTSLVMTNETVTDYVIRAEKAACALKAAGETISDSLLIAMLLKGLPDSYNPFVVVVTQNHKDQTFSDFKEQLRSFEQTELARKSTNAEDSIMNLKTDNRNSRSNVHMSNADSREKPTSNFKCFKCDKIGHIARNCRVTATTGRNKLWCSHCKSNTHSYQSCRRVNRQHVGYKDSAKHVSDHAEPEHSFMFKVEDDISTEYTSNRGKGKLLVDCGATTHIINDISKFITFDTRFESDKHFIELANGSKSNNIALKRGNANVQLYDINGKCVQVMLENALYVPTYPQNIFSIHAATKKGVTISGI